MRTDIRANRPEAGRVRMVAVDMDGTFLDRHGSYDGERFAALRRAMARVGIHFVVASGNQHAQLRRHIEAVSGPVPLPGVWYIAENGGVIAEDAEVLRTTPFRHATAVDELTRLGGMPGVLALACGATTAYRHRTADQALLAAIRPYVDRMRRVDSWSEVPEPVVKIAIACTAEDTGWLLEELRAGLPADVAAVSSGHGSIDLVPAAVNKGTALAWLTDRLGIGLDEVVAFGDGGNDLEMLSMAGLGVAMANAPDEVKAHADDVTLSNDDAGVLVYLEALQATAASGVWPLEAVGERVGALAPVQ